MGNDFKDSQEVLAAHCIPEEDKGLPGLSGRVGNPERSPGKVKKHLLFPILLLDKGDCKRRSWLGF